MSISESNNNIRIRTTPLGSDKYVKINLNQKFDFLEILSLKIGQEQIYKQYCSDYGVIVGRVVVNDGVGVPNAKISVFIPISEEDKQNSIIRSLYPYTTVNDVDNNNIKYNLLFETPRQDDVCHRSVGTFPEKRRILDCDTWCEVYGKYYKYTTSTNASGDYMIFGVPTGVQIVHMDVDLSDIGYLSQKPYDMVGQGSPETLFDSLNQFKTSPNLGQLPQIKTQNKTINVLPFWGDLEQCEIGINRIDFDLNYKLIPNAFFIGSIFTDTAKGSINKRCRPRRNIGTNSMLGTREGTIQMIRKTPNGGTEVFDVNGGRVIDENGTWVVQLPMNLESKITDEFGELVDSGNPNIGIATKAKYRFKIGLDEGGSTGRLRSTAKFLVPNYGDYTFDDTTPETITFQGKPYPNFAEMEWNGVYTVKQFISRFQKNQQIKNKNFIGIKDTVDSGTMNPFPWNSMSQDVSFIFIFLCIIANILGLIILFINAIIITAINSLLTVVDAIVSFFSLGFGSDLVGRLSCLVVPVQNVDFCPGCETGLSNQSCESDIEDFFDAITASLADAFNIFKFDFIHDWINGTLYAFPFKVKLKLNKSKPKFCDVDELIGNDYVVTYQCAGSGTGIGVAGGYSSPFIVQVVDRGLIKYIDGEFFYAPREIVDESRLYPTGIYNLGSMKNCDVLGKPKIVTDIPITTFNIPDDVFTPDDDDISIEPFLANINCVGLNISDQQCLNHRLFCELGVAYDSDNGGHDLLVNGDISEQDYFDTARLRAELECLNVPSICTNCTSPPSGRWTNGDWAEYRTGTILFNGQNINPYDKFILQNVYQRQSIENSFYFYFGITPGKTAMDRLVSQYFAPCDRAEPCIILISGSVVNNVCIGGNTGSITVNPKYGTPPYKYDWYEGFYVFGSTNKSLSTYTETINNLFSGNYTVLVTDSVGNICKKTFTVLDPSRFSVNVDFSPYICPGANNGYINVIPDGGIAPYYIDWSSGAAINTYNTGNTNNSFYLTNLGPTSICVNSGIGTGSGNTTNTPTPINAANSFFTAPLNDTYQFTVIFGEIIVGGAGNCNVELRIYDQNNNFLRNYLQQISLSIPGSYTNYGVNFNPIPMSQNERAYIDIGFGGNVVPNDFDYGIIWSGDSTTSPPSAKFVVERPPLNQFSGALPFDPLAFLQSNYPVAFPNVITNTNNVYGNIPTTSSSGSTTTTSQLYSFVVWDSGGNCKSFSALTVDITQSCGFTLTATSVNDYCNASTRSSISLNVGGGGVPPFTYTIQSTDANYFWSGKTNNNSITRNNIPGGTCPGYTYTATCIDACGSIDSKIVNVTTSKLRLLTSGWVQSLCSRNDCGCNNDKERRFYYTIFAGAISSPNITFTDTCPYAGNGSGGYWVSAGSSSNTINPNTFWWELPSSPNEPLNTTTSIQNWYYSQNCGPGGLSDNLGYTVYRQNIVGGKSRVYWNRTNANNPNNGSNTSGFVDICATETVFVHSLFMADVPDCRSCNWSIKSQGCSDKVTSQIVC